MENVFIQAEGETSVLDDVLASLKKSVSDRNREKEKDRNRER